MTRHLRGWCTNSTGSSIVRMWPGARAVDVIDHRGERGRLAAAGRAGDEHEAGAQLGELADAGGHAELVERQDLRRDRAEHRAGAGDLAQVVRAKPRLRAVRVREVEIAGRCELRALLAA